MKVGSRHRLAGLAYPVLRTWRRRGRTAGRLRVLLYHDVPPAESARFRAQLTWLARRWRFVSPTEFDAMAIGEAPVEGDRLLLTFDDGFASNREIAETVLRPLGIQAVFFVVSDLVDLAPQAGDARAFMARRFFGVEAGQVPPTWAAMGWADLEALLEQGHTIGAHTATHARLSALTSPGALEAEITASADRLASRLGCPIEHFAYTFGDLASTSPAAAALARRRFRFVHSGLRGMNDGRTPHAVRRDSVATIGPDRAYRLFDHRYVGALLEGAADGRYVADLATLDGWGA